MGFDDPMEDAAFIGWGLQLVVLQDRQSPGSTNNNIFEDISVAMNQDDPDVDLLEEGAPQNDVILQPLALSDIHIPYRHLSYGVGLNCALFSGHPLFTQFTPQCSHRTEGALQTPLTSPVTGLCELHH